MIMPFDADFDDVFDRLIRPALHGYDVVRADSHLNQQNILRSIAEGIHGADLVIADVSGTKPNVMYELGAAHAMNKPTVMIARSLTNLPFDVRSYPVQIYATTGDAAAAFATRLRDIGEKHAAGQLRFGNPISDFLPTGIVTAPSADHSEVAQEEDTGYGYLDYSADMEEYGEQVLGQFAKLNELSSRLVADIRALSPAIHQARTAGSAKNEKRLTNQLAGLLQEYADALVAEILPPFHHGWERVGHAMYWMASQKPVDLDPARIEELCMSNAGLHDALRGIITNVTGVRESIITGRGRTGMLDKAIDSMEHAFNSIVSEVMIADAVMAEVRARVGCPEHTSG